MRKADIRLGVYTSSCTTSKPSMMVNIESRIEYERVVEMMHYGHRGESSVLFYWTDDCLFASPQYLESEFEVSFFRRFEFVEGGL